MFTAECNTDFIAANEDIPYWGQLDIPNCRWSDGSLVRKSCTGPNGQKSDRSVVPRVIGPKIIP